MAEMLNDQTDARLLKEFVQSGSEPAFRILTARHVDLVFGTAMRRTGDRSAAEELTQNVFIALSRRAAWLQSESSLAGWLHRAAVLESRQWWRGESRRRQREETAAILETTMKTSEAGVPAVAEAMDEALLQLREGERKAVLLKFFEGRSYRQVGEALGIGEDAARKRVDKALERLTVFFRHRGIAAGSVAVVAASLRAATFSAPAGLGSGIATSVLSTGGCATPAWLAKFLGVGRVKLAAVCLLPLLVPPAWQQVRLASAQSEQRRLAALLADARADLLASASRLAETQRLIERRLSGSTLSQVAVSNSALAGMGVDGLDPRLFRWNEKSDFVRVPKSLLERISFNGLQDKWGLYSGTEKTFDKDADRVSGTVLGVLGLTEQEQAQVQKLFSESLHGFAGWAQSNGYLTEFPSVADVISNLPASFEHNEGTRVWVVPPLPDDGGSWRQQFESQLTGIMGSERAGVLLRMARDDGSLSACLQQFGAESYMLFATPMTSGGILISQRRMKNGQPNWLFNTTVSFSEVLDHTNAVPFDEQAARTEIAQRLAAYRAANPNAEVPPIESILAEDRRLWRARQGALQIVLEGRAVPPAMMDYLRQWRAAHSDVPDAVKSDSLPTHP